MIKIDNFPENEDQREPEDILRKDQESEIQSDTESEPESDYDIVSDNTNDIDKQVEQPEYNDDTATITDQDEQSELPVNESVSDEEIEDLVQPQEQVNVEDFQLQNQKGIIEALIFAASDPITLNQLARTSNLTKASVEDIITELNNDYQDTRRSFRIEHIAGGYRMYTLPEFHSYINQAGVIERTQKLSQAALESLAVIAYKQPITRAEIERIRGVDCGGVLKNLMTKDLIIIDGRSDAPGKPILYRTSEHFLEYFGLSSLDQLPSLSEIEDYTELPKLTIVRDGENNGNGSEEEDSQQSEIASRLANSILSISEPEDESELYGIQLDDDAVSN